MKFNEIISSCSPTIWNWNKLSMKGPAHLAVHSIINISDVQMMWESIHICMYLIYFTNKSKTKGKRFPYKSWTILIWKLIWGNTLRSAFHFLYFALLPSLFMHEDDFTFHGNGNTFTVVRLLICLVTDCWTLKSREI